MYTSICNFEIKIESNLWENFLCDVYINIPPIYMSVFFQNHANLREISFKKKFRRGVQNIPSWWMGFRQTNPTVAQRAASREGRARSDWQRGAEKYLRSNPGCFSLTDLICVVFSRDDQSRHPARITQMRDPLPCNRTETALR